jgi:hypothetical protein
VFDAEARIDREHAQKASTQQPGAGQEYQRNGDLGGDNRAAEAVAAQRACVSLAAFDRRAR